MINSIKYTIVLDASVTGEFTQSKKTAMLRSLEGLGINASIVSIGPATNANIAEDVTIVSSDTGTATGTSSESDSQSININQGMIAWYQFKPNLSDPNHNGYDLSDSSGNGNDGTLATDFGLPGFSTKNAYASFTVDYGGAYITVDDASGLNLGSQFTISVMVKRDRDDSSAFRPIISKLDDSGSSSIYEMSLCKNGVIVYLPGITSTNNLSPNKFLWTIKEDLKQWNHIALVGDETGISLYVNGTPCGKVDIKSGGTLNSSGNVLRIGKGFLTETLTNTAYFRGSMDDLRIYDSALSEDQIKKLYVLDSLGKSAENP